jgi:hypothetical protein
LSTGPEERNGRGRVCRQLVELEDRGIVGQNLSFDCRGEGFELGGPVIAVAGEEASATLLSRLRG